ncbi:MAG: DUF2185 domain-containing protein [Acidobacteriota bacterium]
MEAAHEAYPDTFHIPAADERSTREVGELVRVHFVLDEEGPDLPRAERMWVEVVERTGNPPRYVGMLKNQPRSIRDLGVGDRISFGPEHVACVVIRRTDARWFGAAEQYAMVSAMALEPGGSVRFMYRETPSESHADDSGWRLFSGLEDDAYSNDAKNVRLCRVGWLCERDPSLLPAIRAEIGAVFERRSPTDSWTAVTDWSPPREP